MKNISKLPEPRGRERFLTQEERVRLLQVCHGSSCKLLFPIVLLALSTGMRKAEILGIKWKDIDLDSGRITLHHTKNGDSRVVPVKGLALTKLQDLASPHKCNPGYLEEYVFATKKGGKPIDFRGSWKTALALSEIKNFTFHDIRHDYITALSSLGYPLHVISRIVGHRSHAITASRYSHLSLEHAERAATEIGTGIENNYVHFLRHIDINPNNALECKVIS